MNAALDILRKLLRDPAAAAGLVIVLLLVAIAVLAPLIATHPEAVWDMNCSLLSRSWRRSLPRILKRCGT